MEKWTGKIAYVGADARQSGTFQGEIVAATENKGDFNGNGTVDYVMIMGNTKNVDAQYRTEYSIKALNDAGITTNKLFEQRGDWLQENGQQLAATALAQFGQGYGCDLLQQRRHGPGRLSGDRGCWTRGK